MGSDVDRTMQRARRYWYEDGLAEIAVGCVLIAIGLLFLAEGLGLIPGGVSSLGLIGVVFGGWALSGWAVRRAKERITYPRTGYARYGRPEGRRRSRLVTAAIGAGMGAIVALLFALTPASLSWIPALDGILIGSFLLYLGSNLGLSRFYTLAVLSALIGAAASLGGLADLLGSGVYFTAIGVAVLASGSIVLASYLSHTRPPEGE